MTQAILTVVIIIAFAFAASVFTYLTICGVQDSNDQKEFDKIAKTINVSNKDDSSDETNGVYELMLKNKDCIGWLKVANTDIDYPVMLTKDEPEYYLRRNFNKSYSYMGTPFMDANCNIGISKNLIIYGHNMKNLSMFGKLKQMKEQEKYKDSVYFWMLTPESNDVYQIFSAFYTEADSDVYTLYSGGGEAFVQYLNTMAARSEIPVEQPEMDENSHIIVLSTCAASDTTGRFVVLGVRRNR